MKKVKICGLSKPEDIAIVNRFRPDYCGFIINFPKSHRNVSILELEHLTQLLDASIPAVGVFVNQPVSLVAELLNRRIIDIVQLHGAEDSAYIDHLRSMTTAPIWRAFQIKTAADLSSAAECNADFVLLDAGQGCGQAFDWSLLSDFHRPYALAGGLSMENVHRALSTTATLLDVSGGVETNKRKDAHKIEQFIQSVRS